MSSGQRSSPDDERAQKLILIAIALMVVLILAPLAMLIGLASQVEAAHPCRDSSQQGTIVRLLCWNTGQSDVNWLFIRGLRSGGVR